MNSALRMTGLVVTVLLLSSCGLFDDKDEELEPKKLVKLKDFNQKEDVPFRLKRRVDRLSYNTRMKPFAINT